MSEYGICLDCDTKHADRAAMLEHGKATLAPTGEMGVVARGHRSQVTNPTPEEVRQNRVRYLVSYAVEGAIDNAYSELERAIRREGVTKDEVTAELGLYPDFAEGWQEWWDEGDD